MTETTNPAAVDIHAIIIFEGTAPSIKAQNTAAIQGLKEAGITFTSATGFDGTLTEGYRAKHGFPGTGAIAIGVPSGCNLGFKNAGFNFKTPIGVYHHPLPPSA